MNTKIVITLTINVHGSAVAVIPVYRKRPLHLGEVIVFHVAAINPLPITFRVWLPQTNPDAVVQLQRKQRDAVAAADAGKDSSKLRSIAK